jgi:hypothetical protein
LQEALLFAEANRPELEKVLAHYSVNPADSSREKGRNQLKTRTVSQA